MNKAIYYLKIYAMSLFMSFTEISILFFAGLTSGIMNSLAGGGTFVSFPALVFLGIPPITANATATLALWPGTFASTFAYRKELMVHKEKILLYVILSVLGGLAGSLLLLVVSNEGFAKIVPYLLLTATMLFTFRSPMIRLIRRNSEHSPDKPETLAFKIISLVLFIIVSIYGGFFGAGMGIMLLALFSLMGMQNMHEMNGLRSCCNLFANTIAAITFMIAGIVAWPQALIMAIGSISGGYFGARCALKLPQSWSRNAVIAIGWTITVYFFLKQGA